jgi:alanyl-tRNA synthetase
MGSHRPANAFPLAPAHKNGYDKKKQIHSEVTQMKTRKLYEEDSYRRSFTAQVLSCQEEKGRWAVVLDQTCFFPEGGGQPWDTGTLGDTQVEEVHTRGEEIVHYVSAPLPVGAEVTGEINWQRRFDFTQQHSGEHIVSGLICRKYGYDNVGFHLGKGLVTVDWNGPLTWQQVKEIEAEANRVIWANGETEIFYPTPEELAKLDYRSKKELSGQVRIVRFPGSDTCACCGTHVKRAGEVGLIRILSVQKLRDGVRCEMLSGRWALEHDAAVWEQNRQISVALSARELETAQAVLRLKEEKESLSYRLYGLVEEKCRLTAQSLQGKGNCLLHQEGLSADELRRMTAAVLETCGGICAAFAPRTNEAGFYYCMGWGQGDLRPLTKAMNQALQGRGGGKPGFVQGTVQGDWEEIQAFFQAQGWKI